MVEECDYDVKVSQEHHKKVLLTLIIYVRCLRPSSEGFYYLHLKAYHEAAIELALAAY